VELLTAELLVKRLGRESSRDVLAWVRTLYEEQKHRAIICDDKDAMREKAQGQLLHRLMLELTKLINE
jgi:uncharacterized membrane protein